MLQDLNTGFFVHASLFTYSIYILQYFTYLPCPFSVIAGQPRLEFMYDINGEDWFMHVFYKLKSSSYKNGCESFLSFGSKS
jgi:hypothetical protein